MIVWFKAAAITTATTVPFGALSLTGGGLQNGTEVFGLSPHCLTIRVLINLKIQVSSYIHPAHCQSRMIFYYGKTYQIAN